MSLPEKFLKPFDAQSIEDGLYAKWLASGLFNPDICVEKGYTKPDAESFSIVLPPPNVTGTLHTGHAFMLAIEDIMVRYNRMQGKKTLWIPGTDHAAISTESVIVKQLSKEGTTKFKIGREEFLKRVNAFAQESHDTIVGQTKKMGASLDWSREAFTLDEQRHHAVVTAFKTMYDDGLIYRGDRIVNWDPKGQTTVSDDEVDREEEISKFYYFKYGPFVIGTARPETKFGDKYVVMHPDDARFSEYIHGQKIELEWINGPMTATVIKDTAIDMEFGTGVMTITPWHSAIDFEIAEKYNLDKEQIIDMYGKLLPIAGEFAGMKIEEARAKIVEKLDQKGLLVKIEDNYKHQKAISQRTKATIEPQIMKQWWIDVNKPIVKRNNLSLKELMLRAVREDGITIIPDRFEKIYFNWIENLRDWNISRQIWYGHQIPVWYNKEEIHVGTKPDGDNWVQDQDTLDTWFSSGLWTFSTLGWPENTNDLRTYHPTSVLETGHDIIFFWVARMILMSTYLLGEIPFKTVYMHGMVLDKNGKKMSKSNPETAIDPLLTIEKYGADALRMAMIVGVGAGQDVSLSEDKIKAYSKFANKIWNGTRFVLEQTNADDLQTKPVLDPEHAEYINQWDTLSTEITKEMDEFRYYLVSEKLYHFFWHTFADIVIEKCKSNMNDSARYTLRYLLHRQLIALHPFMPFITEEIWGSLYPDGDLLMITPWMSDM
jgi:valyl-tRNA synthetase